MIQDFYYLWLTFLLSFFPQLAQFYFSRYTQLFSDDGKLYVTFDHLHEKLVMQTVNGCPFEISGEDNLFYPAKADVIHGNVLCISNPAVKFPSAVKYAWYNFGEAVLFTESGNPVSPFFKCV